MAITRTDIRTMGVAVTAAFLRGLQGNTPPLFERFTTRVNMPTKVMEAPIAGAVGPLREWKGSRIYQNVMRDAMSFAAKKFEKTITIQRDDLEDDNVGVYMPSIQQLGVQVRMWPDQQVFKALELNGNGYDGVPMFSASHPVTVSGVTGTASNYQAGSDPAWYLFDTRQPMGPMIWGERIAPEIVARQDPDDPHVFDRDEFVWGVRARGVATYGLWQAAFKSKAALTAANFEAAVSAMRNRVDEENETLNLEPNLLVVSAASQFDAMRLFGRQALAGGEENILQNAIVWAASNRLTGA